MKAGAYFRKGWGIRAQVSAFSCTWASAEISMQEGDFSRLSDCGDIAPLSFDCGGDLVTEPHFR